MIAEAGKSLAKGEYRLIKHDCSKIQGSGPGGAVMFHDLWETVGDGSAKNPFRYRPKTPIVEESVTQDISTRNKITKRGLSYWLFRCHMGLEGIGASGGNTHPSVTYNSGTNPFVAFFMGTKRTSAPLMDGDERPLWNESNGQYDVLVSAGMATIAEGRRALLLSTTTGSALKRVETRYPTTDPYREVEYTFFAQASVPTYSTGGITVDSANLPADGKIITFNDGINPTFSLEFDTTGGVLYNDSTNRYLIDISGAPTDAQLRDLIVAAFNRAALNYGIYLVATAGGAALVTLTHTSGGAIGNKAVTSDFTPLGSWALPTLSGGGGSLEAGTDNYVDNFPIRCCGLAEGVACGNGESANRIGVHAVLGIAPTFQGLCDRPYYHEFLTVDQSATGDIVAMSKYISTSGGVVGDGYVARSTAVDLSGEQARTIVDTAIGIDAANDINNTTNVITLPLAPTALSATGGFKSSAHVRKVLEITGSGSGNDAEYTIKRVLSPDKVEVYETPVANETGGTLVGTVYDTYYGKNAFDGRVINQGRIETVTDPDVPGDIVLGQKWVSDDNAGAHVLGRVWAVAKTVRGIRIIGAAGTNKNFYPDAFTIQYLDPTKNGGNPRPGVDADWTNVGGTAIYTSQSTNIYDAGAYGYEYTFTAVATKGLRLSTMTALSNTRRVEIGEMMIFGALPSVTLVSGVNDRLKFSVDGGTTWFTVDVGNFGPSTSFTSLADKLNAYLRGFQVEVARNAFGYLWMRGTVAGGKSTLDIAAIADSTMNADIGLPSIATQTTGITQEVRKLPPEALTIIYRVNISGDLSQPS